MMHDHPLRCATFFVFAGMLCVFAGCKKTPPKSTPHDVKITACAADPDPVEVGYGDTITWTPTDGHDYSIRFANPNEPTPNPFPAKHGVPNPAHPIHGHTGCPPKENGYYCEYSLTRDTEDTPCADPGVYIKP